MSIVNHVQSKTFLDFLENPEVRVLLTQWMKFTCVLRAQLNNSDFLCKCVHVIKVPQ